MSDINRVISLRRNAASRNWKAFKAERDADREDATDADRETTTDTTLADKLNRHLAAGGTVQVTTYGKSWLYGKRHRGMFRDRDGSLYVARGRTFDRLSHGERLLVGLRMV